MYKTDMELGCDVWGDYYIIILLYVRCKYMYKTDMEQAVMYGEIIIL